MPFCSKLAADFLCHPVKVTIGSQDLAASHSVTQVGWLRWWWRCVWHGAMGKRGTAGVAASSRMLASLRGDPCSGHSSSPGKHYSTSSASLLPSSPLSQPPTPLQVVEVIEDRARDGRLHDLLQRYHSSRTNRVIIFVLYKKEAVRVEQALQRKGWKVRGKGRWWAGGCMGECEQACVGLAGTPTA